jgi:hypothetical protein
MLSIRLKRSVIRIRSFVEEDLRRLKDFDGFVFVIAADVKGFEALAEELGLSAVMTGRFKTFYSRQTWIRFAREDATAEDWKEALNRRSLETLTPAVYYYRVRPHGGGERSKLKAES